MGRPRSDPTLLEARGAYRKNPKRGKDEEQEEAEPADEGVKHPPLRVDYAAAAKKYAEDVVSGAIVVGKYVKLACDRHLNNLAREREPDYPYRFDADAANLFCARAERFPHIKGRWASRKEKLKLEPWQCFCLAVPFGWKRKKDGLRRFREIYLEVPRKNSKSTLAAVIGNNMLLDDGEHGAEVYSGATTEKQAWEVFGPAKLMLEKSPHIRNAYGIEIWSKSMVKGEDNSRFWPLIGKPGDGASPSCSIHDEYHEHLSSDQVDSMQTGMGAREQPMMVIITTSGTNLASPCYDKHAEAKKVLEGIFEQEQLFAIIYSIDDGDDWADPKTLRKANPNLGVSVDEEFLIAQQRQAVLNPSYQNRFKTKHLDVWCAASVAGINMHDWKLCADPGLTLDEFKGEEVFFILDLASKLDVCDYVKLFRRKVGEQMHYYAFARHYLPEDTIEEAKSNQQAYRKWHAQGRLIATPGAEIDFDIIREDVKADSKLYQVAEVLYDPWRATQLAHQLSKDGAKVVEVGQIAKNLGEAFDELNSALRAGRFHHDGDPVLEWMASNTIARQVAKGLTVPGKEKNKPDQKIDGIVAIVMGIGRAMVDTTPKYQLFHIGR
jgi:phage terminase large subunit-like protein